ncbi:AAA family ATPase [Spirulina subsalsa FACHB-351]|uniref:AAA family ATPase n=1 Tax=Spirulina subsalsa FACHB-351 TaxID=234711 RepID=A0ABT3L9K9_9CYAN|nr:AAA family ATPase [Spirulina subsalsa]MCW6038189.1 AAA family ATPase [Spirulina subsalsa FACHB-351]
MRIFNNITIQQFRGLRDLELKDLSQINVLVGINNSGKTSILEALFLYSNPLDIQRLITLANLRENTNSSRYSTLENLLWLFPQLSDHLDDDLLLPEIKLYSEGIKEIQRINISYQNQERIKPLASSIKEDQMYYEDDFTSEREASNIVRGIKLEFKIYTHQLNLWAEPHIHEKITLWEDEPRFRSPKANSKAIQLPVAFITPFSHRSHFSQLRLLSQASFENLKPNVIQLLNYMDENIIDLEILMNPKTRWNQPSIYVQHKKLGLTPINTLGDGVRRLLHIALQIPRARDGILLIDELESTIHTEALHDAFEWLVTWCQKMNVQLFATTHSLEAVDHLLEVTNSANDLAFYRLEPTDYKTKVVRHDWERLKILREELGQEVRW